MRQTVLFAEHQQLGASFTDFGGWNMPVRYQNELVEHAAVRTSSGMFDISHMGEIWVRGEASALNFAVTVDVEKISVGRAKYSLILNEAGGIIDDLIVYRTATDEFLVISNASNYPRVAAELRARCEPRGAEVIDESDEWALIAVQGPTATSMLQSVADLDLGALRYYSIAQGSISGIAVYFARTGYTGEDGFELMVRTEWAAELWRRLLAVGVSPAGLAARDTLRLEAGMPLYGNELSEQVTPAAVGLMRSVALDTDFVGRSALAAAEPPLLKLVGLVGDGRRAARHDYPVLLSGVKIGVITSGALSPTLGYPIAMALVNHDAAGTVQVDIRGTELDFEITGLPFYKRG